MVTAEEREDYEEAEIVVDGIVCWLGEHRISRRTVTNLINHLAISLASEPGSLRRFSINGTGREIVLNPAVADKIIEAVRRGGAFDEKGDALTF